MNKIIIFVACTCLVLASCNDFLEEKPKSLLSSRDFNKTEDQIRSNINGLYRRAAVTAHSSASSAYIGSAMTLPGMLTGYYSNSYEGQERVCAYARTLTRQEQTNNVSGFVDGIWGGCYGVINVANVALKSMPEVPMSDEARKVLSGEAKFFRAFNYFMLVKWFGDVPMTTQPSKNVNDLEKPRTPVADIYTLIEQDLTEAVAALPDQTWQKNGHRISKYVALQALTAVYMQQGKYQQASETAKQIINSGKYSLTENEDKALKSAYNKLRTLDDLPEVLYAVEYDADISTTGWRPTYAFSSSATNAFKSYNIFQRVYGPNARYLNIYTADDLRGQEQQFFATKYKNPNNDSIWTAPSADDRGCWYYFDEEAVLKTGRGTKDWNIYRYAETLLDAAESLVQSGGTVTPEAAGYLAMVQARALGKTQAALTTELSALSKEAFIEACWTERLREFPLEYKLWDDCLRTKKFPDISATELGKVTYVDLVGATNGSGAVIKASDLLWPLSLNEMQRNPQLRPQNDGYASK